MLNLQQQKRQIYLVSKPNYRTINFSTKKLLAIEMRKTQILINKSLDLRLSILDLSKAVMSELWSDYVKPKYDENAKLCYMGTDSFVVDVKRDDSYKNIAEDVETRFDTSNFELDRALAKGKNKRVIGLMKDELGGQIMTKFAGLRAKTSSYLIDDGSENKKENGSKKCTIKRKLKFTDYKICLEAPQIENKISHLEKIKIDADSLKEDHKEFIKNNKLILKTQQEKFKREKHNGLLKNLIRLL